MKASKFSKILLGKNKTSKYNSSHSMSSADENRIKIQDIRRRMLNGELTYEQAKEEAQPIIKQINFTAKQLARKYNLRPRNVGFSEMMR